MRDLHGKVMLALLAVAVFAALQANTSINGYLKDAGEKAGAPAAKLDREEVRAVRVIDGRTVRVRSTSGEANPLIDNRPEPFTVRLVGLAAADGGCGGTAAERRLRKLLFRNGRGRALSLLTEDGKPRQDAAGRVLGHLRVGDTSVQRSLLRAGVVRTEPAHRGRLGFASMRKAERQAQTKHRGPCWSGKRAGVRVPAVQSAKACETGHRGVYQGGNPSSARGRTQTLSPLAKTCSQERADHIVDLCPFLRAPGSYLSPSSPSWGLLHRVMHQPLPVSRASL